MEMAYWRRQVFMALAGVAIGGLLGFAAEAQAGAEVEAGAAFLSGPINGWLQTPRGGEPGTTSRHRPTLKEIGIDDTRTGDYWLNLSLDPHGLYLGGRMTDLSGDDTLDSALVSQGQTFPAGSLVKAKVMLDWYRFGYRYRLPLDWNGRKIQLYPSIGAVLLDFQYKLSSAGLDGVDRSYLKGGAQVGLTGEAELMDRLSLSAQAMLPIPLSTSADIFTSQLTLKYAFIKNSHVGLWGLVGIGYDTIHYEDSQTVPNKIKVDMGPLWLLGVEATF